MNILVYYKYEMRNNRKIYQKQYIVCLIIFALLFTMKLLILVLHLYNYVRYCNCEVFTSVVFAIYLNIM
jgi:hypothetical protein